MSPRGYCLQTGHLYGVITGYAIFDGGGDWAEGSATGELA